MRLDVTGHFSRMDASNAELASITGRILRTDRKSFAGVTEAYAQSKQAAFVVTCSPADRYRIIDGKIDYADVEAESTRVVRPLEDDRFFTSFANLAARGDPADKSIRRWAEQYGLLTPPDPKTGRPEPMALRDFKQEARRAYELLKLLEDVWSRDVAAMRRRWAERYFAPFYEAPASMEDLPDEVVIELTVMGFERVLEDKTKDVRLGHARFVPETRETGKTLADDEAANIVEALGLQDLKDPSKTRTIESEPHPATHKPYRAQRSYRCDDLRSALYLQLDLMYVDQRPMKRCEQCGEMMFYKRRSKKYCGSTCDSNAKNARDRREPSAG